MKISIVATLFYSEKFIDEFYSRVVEAVRQVSADYEFIFVNDGSPDRSAEKILSLQEKDDRIVLVDLSRNFGHQQAIMTGLRYCTGDYIFLIDTDLEEDPEVFNVLWKALSENRDYDMVYGVQPKRKGRFFEKISGRLFYKFFEFIAGFEYPADTLTARIMTKRYLDRLKEFSEKDVDVWGLFLLNGFKQMEIPFEKKHKGSTTFTFRKKVKIAIDATTSLTHRPLYFIFFLGLFISIVSFLSILYIVYRKLVHNVIVEGWTSIIASVWFIGGIIMFTLGIIAIYLSKIFIEVKNRPMTTVRNVYKKR